MLRFAPVGWGACCAAGALAACVLCGAPGAVAEEEGSPRVVLVPAPDGPAAAGDVAAGLGERLAQVGVDVELQATAAPAAPAEWVALARQAARERPGTLALAGWRCEEGGQSCAVTLVEPEGGGFAEITVPRGSDEALAGNLAAVIAEAVLGDLLAELRDLPAGEKEEPPPADDDAGEDEGASPGSPGEGAVRLWIEGGYAGEYAHPGDGALHGPYVGTALAPCRYLAPALSVGWLGIARGEGTAGEATAHRLPVSLAIRLRLPVGAATFAVAPMGRLDTVFSSRDSAGPGGARSAVDLEIHVGGAMTWHLPFPGGIEAVVGAGVLATVLGEDLAIDGERIIGVSDVRLLWTAGLAWDPSAR